ncbi:MAG: dTDP-4-dehydrorhamnose 3,5-epimerase [Saprospiraceae bacterium]|nr:dTDP-4-dehydrorhamnose 3,5-epimerase [Saprospiraceae bacterium]
MAWIKTNFKGVWTFEPKIWKDQRGYFIESFNISSLPVELKKIDFKQDNEAKSTRGVLRGLHYQLPPNAQSKLVRCVTGEILDIIVDIRPDSDTFGKYLSVILNEINKKQLFVPSGFAHGYVVLSETAIVSYKCDHFYDPLAEGGLKYNDPTMGINWILSNEQLVISEKDTNLPVFGEHKTFVV